jgi:hypothetical protein
MPIYVDDIVLAGYSAITIECLGQTLAQNFPINDLGCVDYFLGIEASYTSQGMILTRPKYALDLLQCAQMEGCRIGSTQMSNSAQFSFVVYKVC